MGPSLATCARGTPRRLATRPTVSTTWRSADSLADLEREAYTLACSVEAGIGREATLRGVRDGLRAALAPVLRGTGKTAEAAELAVLRVGDAVWQAHSDTLLQTIQREQEGRYKNELTLAKRIQERLLPRSIPKIPGFDIAGRVLPAAEVGVEQRAVFVQHLAEHDDFPRAEYVRRQPVKRPPVDGQF